MNDATHLLRQVHPAWIQAGRATSQVFRPTPKDQNRLSVHDGDLITPQDAWRHFTEVLGWPSSGVLGVTVGECRSRDLQAFSDPAPYPQHAVIDFGSLGRAEVERKSKQLKSDAEVRGWLYRPD
jgi:hypothetical protein